MQKTKCWTFLAISMLALASGRVGAQEPSPKTFPLSPDDEGISVFGPQVLARPLVLAAYSPQAVMPLLHEPVPTQDIAAKAQINKIIRGDANWPEAIPVEVRQSLIDLYTRRDARPLWFGPGGWDQDLARALDQVAHADQDGLTPSDYFIEDLDAYVRAYSILDLAASELILSAHFLPYVHDMINGRHPPKARFNAIEVLDTGSQTQGVGPFFESLIPDKLEYQRLRSALAELRDNPASSPHIPQLSNGPNLRRGSRSGRVADLRYILTLTGDYRPDPAVHYAFDFDATVFDDQLKSAVIAYQRRHELSADGIVGPGTRRTLNYQNLSHIRLIKVNMERLRWEAPLNGETSYVRVNIPQYRLHVRQGGEIVLDMQTIVGRVDRQTPLMSDRIVNLKFSPDWTVPSTIYNEDLLPKLRADPAFAKSSGYTILTAQGAVGADTIDWFNPPSVTLYKHPSSSGPLGGVRFSLTNHIGIFLHDTNQRSLFNRSRLTLSSGCVRVGDPVALARFLTQDDGWSTEQIENAMKRGKISWKTIKDEEGVPVFLSYMTIFVDENGQLIRTDDPYAKDQELSRFFDNS